MDFIRQHLAAARGEAPAPAEAADTVEETVEEVVEAADSAEEEIPADAEIAPEAELSSEEEEVLYLELDDDTQALIDTKYGGDINKALVALRESQSMLGRQANEVGDLRKELGEMRQAMEQGFRQAEPYPEWPDEFAEPQEAALQYRQIAEAAFAREDVETFALAVDSWREQDAVGATNYRDLKILQMQTAMAQQPPSAEAEDTVLADGIASLQEKYPQFGSQDPAFTAEMDAELQKLPSLKRLLWGEIPGVTPQERLTALEETIQRVASRQTAETERAARRRVAVRTSEEARQARREAQVVSGESARVAEEEPVRRTVQMGKTGRTLDLDRVAALSGEDINL